jgi:hypothetical protein
MISKHLCNTPDHLSYEATILSEMRPTVDKCSVPPDGSMLLQQRELRSL